VTVKARTVIVLTCTLRILIDNLFGLQLQLHQLGYEHVYIVAELTPKIYDILEFKAWSLGGKVFHIPVSTFDVSFFGQNAVIYNSEQTWCDQVFVDGLIRYQELLNQEKAVLWTFNQASLSHFISRFDQQKSWMKYQPKVNYMSVVSYHYIDQRPLALRLGLLSKTTFAPLASTALIHLMLPLKEYFESSPALMPYLLTLDDILDEEIESQQEHIFALFYGTCSARRIVKMSKFEQWINQHHYEFRNVSHRLKFYNMCGIIQFDHIKDYYVLRSRLIINVQSYSRSALETHRLNQLLALGKVVISERGADPELSNTYQDGIVFVDEDRAMFDTMINFLQNDTLFYEQERKVNTFYQKLSKISLQEVAEAMNKSMQYLYS
jgi:hypothetical protein